METDEAVQEAKYKEAISRAVQIAVASSSRPKPVHGSEYGRFWARGEEDEEADSDSTSDCDSGEETASISSPEFIKEAAAVSFSVQDLYKAEHELTEEEKVSNDTSSSAGNSSLATRIVEAMVQRKLRRVPWQGPLPPPRASPPRTIGDVLDEAIMVGSPRGRHGSKCLRASSSAVLSASAMVDGRSAKAQASGSMTGFQNSSLMFPDFPVLARRCAAGFEIIPRQHNNCCFG